MHNHMINAIHRYLRTQRPPAGTDDKYFQDKTYPRMTAFPLPAMRDLSYPIGAALQRRQSVRTFVERGPLPLAKLSDVLGHSIAVRNDKKRPYPSGGMRYPIEAYIVNFSVTDLPSGVFHYDPSAHSLRHLWDVDPTVPVYKENDAAAWAENSSASIILTGFWEKTTSRYGDFGYALALLEAGHIAQNILLVATALGIGAVPMGGFDDYAVSRLLDLDETREQSVYGITLMHLPQQHE